MVSHKYNKDLKHEMIRGYVLFFAFAPNGTSNPTAVWSKSGAVTRTGVGVFRITLDSVFKTLVFSSARLRLGTNANLDVQITDVDLESKTIDLELYKVVSEGDGNDATRTLTDHTYDAADVIEVMLVLGGSSKDVT